MAKNDSTAERELLKAIEGESSFVKNQKPGGIGDLSDLIKSRVLYFLDKLKERFGDNAKQLSPSSINKILVLIIAVLFLWGGTIGVFGLSKMRNMPDFKIKEPKIKAVTPEVKVPLKEYSYYVDVLLGRNIFLEAEEKKVTKEASLPMIQKLIEPLKVTGISWSDDKDDRYAMIENTNENLTYFLQEGDKVSNLLVKKIYKNKLLFGYGDEEIELR